MASTPPHPTPKLSQAWMALQWVLSIFYGKVSSYLIQVFLKVEQKLPRSLYEAKEILVPTTQGQIKDKDYMPLIL